MHISKIRIHEKLEKYTLVMIIRFFLIMGFFIIIVWLVFIFLFVWFWLFVFWSLRIFRFLVRVVPSIYQRISCFWWLVYWMMIYRFWLRVFWFWIWMKRKYIQCSVPKSKLANFEIPDTLDQILRATLTCNFKCSIDLG